MFQERLSTLRIRYIKSEKLRQTNCNEFLDNFVMKKTGQNLFNCSALCSALLDLMIVAFYFFIRISIMTAKAKCKPVQSPRWPLVSSALPNLNMKHYKSVKILPNFQNVKSPCENLSPLFKTFWRRFWFLLHIFSRDSLVAFDSYQSEKIRNTRIVNAVIVDTSVMIENFFMTVLSERNFPIFANWLTLSIFFFATMGEGSSQVD